MAITKTTTATNPRLAIGLGGFAALLAFMAAANLFCTLRPLEARNDKVEAGLQSAPKQPFSERIAELTRLRVEQENILARKPTDPFAWSRLAYLRRASLGDTKGAVQALRMADMVSPHDPRQTVGRAEMWRDLRPYESDEEKKYQDVLWQKAASLDGKRTWETAVARGWVKEVEEALKGGDPTILKSWVEQENYTGQH